MNVCLLRDSRTTIIIITGYPSLTIYTIVISYTSVGLRALTAVQTFMKLHESWITLAKKDTCKAAFK